MSCTDWDRNFNRAFGKEQDENFRQQKQRDRIGWRSNSLKRELDRAIAIAGCDYDKMEEFDQAVFRALRENGWELK